MTLQSPLSFYHFCPPIRLSITPTHFLVADTQLYKRLCPSVRPSVGWLVGPSRSSLNVGKRAFPHLPTRPQLVAVYPALLALFLLKLAF